MTITYKSQHSKFENRAHQYFFNMQDNFVSQINNVINECPGIDKHQVEQMFKELRGSSQLKDVGANFSGFVAASLRQIPKLYKLGPAAFIEKKKYLFLTAVKSMNDFKEYFLKQVCRPKTFTHIYIEFAAFIIVMQAYQIYLNSNFLQEIKKFLTTDGELYKFIDEKLHKVQTLIETSNKHIEAFKDCQDPNMMSIYLDSLKVKYDFATTLLDEILDKITLYIRVIKEDLSKSEQNMYLSGITAVVGVAGLVLTPLHPLTMGGMISLSAICAAKQFEHGKEVTAVFVQFEKLKTRIEIFRQSISKKLEDFAKLLEVKSIEDVERESMFALQDVAGTIEEILESFTTMEKKC